MKPFRVVALIAAVSLLAAGFGLWQITRYISDNREQLRANQATIAQLQRILDAEAAEIRALARQVRDLGGTPVVVTPSSRGSAGGPSTASTGSPHPSPAPRRSRQPHPSPTPHPTPSPTPSPGPGPGPLICLPIVGCL